MKKLLLMLAVGAFVFSVASCSKVCKCYDNKGKLVIEYPKEVDKKGCDAFNTAMTLAGGKCAME